MQKYELLTTRQNFSTLFYRIFCEHIIHNYNKSFDNQRLMYLNKNNNQHAITSNFNHIYASKQKVLCTFAQIKQRNNPTQ